MNNLFNNQLKYLSFHKYKHTNYYLPPKAERVVYSHFSCSSVATFSQIISRSSLVIKKIFINLTKQKNGLINSHYQNQFCIGSFSFMYMCLFNHFPFIRKNINLDDIFIFYSRNKVKLTNDVFSSPKLEMMKKNLYLLNYNSLLLNINSHMNIIYHSPLENILITIFLYNILILILIIIFLFLILNRFFFKSNSEFIIPFIEKNMQKKCKIWTLNKFNSTVDKVIDYNKNFMLCIFIINSIMLITMILINIYASTELFSNIDEYVEVHNCLNNNKSVLFIISFIPKNYNLFYNIRKDNNGISLDNYNKGIKTFSIQNNKNKNESLIGDEGVTITDHSISDLRPLQNDIESVNNFTSPETTQNNKEKSLSASPLNLQNKQSDTNESNKQSLAISKDTTTILSRKRINFTEGDWKEMWSRKFKKFYRLGLYTPDLSDKLLFAYVNEKKKYIKSKYSFNDFLSGSQLITYNFNKNFQKVDLNSLYKYLKSFFRTLSCLISFPVLEVYSDKIKIRLFYFVVPSKTKQNIHKSLHRYIRSDEKLYKELILRRNFKNIMEQFKMKIFIAKWKEDNYFIRIPDPISFFKGLTLTLNENSLRYLYKSGTAPAELGLEQLNEKFRSSNYEFNRPYKYYTTLDLLKLDLSKLSQQHDQLKPLFDGGAGGALKFNEKGTDTLLLRSDHDSSLESVNESLVSLRDCEIKENQNIKQISSIGLQNIKVSKNSISLIKDVSSQNPEEFLPTDKFKTLPRGPEAAELQSKNTRDGARRGTKGESVISTSKDTNVSMLEVSASTLTNKSPESLIKLTDRKVSTIVSLNRVKFKYLIYTLEKFLKKTIILDLIRLKYPYHESNILAQVLSLSCRTKDFRQIMRKLLYTATISNPTKMVRKQNFSIIPSYLSGIKVRLGGRLITQRVVPRFTVQSFQTGSLARGKVNFTDSSRITLKNKRGAFSFTVTTSHIFDK